MKRRDVIGIATAGALTVPFGADAQRMPRLPSVALVFIGVPLAEMAGANPMDSHARAFVHGMRDLGYSEGRNIIIERRSAEGRLERLPTLMREVTELRVDVIVALGPGLDAAANATATTPIVGVVDDFAGLAASLARPGGNVTGLTLDTGLTIYGKRLQLLKEVAPKASRVSILGGTAAGAVVAGSEVGAARMALGLTLLSPGSDNSGDIQDTLAAVGRDRPDALLVLNTPFTYLHRRQIIEFAAKYGLPAIYESREYVEAGGLISYGTDVDDLYRRAATYVDKILKGRKPGELPIEQPTRFNLAISLKAAKALGLTVSQSLLLQADEVIR